MIQYLVLLGAAVNLYGTVMYMRDILRGQTKPNLVSWVLWAAAPLIASAAAFSAGVQWAVLPTLRKAWKFPETESGIAYTTALFNMLTTLAALRIFSFSEVAFPIYNIAINIVISFAVYRKKLLGVATQV